MATSPQQPQMKGTLGLTGLTMNAMALIAPGAFLWLTYAQQSQYGAPMAGMSMWFGILAPMAKFIIGWSSHLYYWIYPGLMVGVTAILSGYLAAQLWPETFNGSIFS